MLRLRVKEIADGKKISMTKLSQRSEVSYNTVKAIFRNPYRPVSTEILERLAKVLGVPATELLEDVPDAERDAEQQNKHKSNGEE